MTRPGFYSRAGNPRILRYGRLAAGCVIAPENAPDGMNVILSEEPKLDFARAAAFLHPRPESRGARGTQRR